LFVAAFVLLGFRLGARPIGDNSMFTHLRTGIDMVAGRGIPRTDPYSFTARGHHWVVQSWLPEWTYGWAHRLGGFSLVVLEQAVVMAGLAWLVVRLARTGKPLMTAAGGAVAMGVGLAYWLPRPLLFGLLCMALTITIVERRRSPWLLVPVVWLWINSHGSFPLGAVWLACHAVGQGIDRRAWPADSVRYIAGFVVGAVVAVANPLGARLLAFPLTLGVKASTFATIREWKSPDFQSAGGRVSLVFLSLALVILFRARLVWRDLLPVIVFVGLGLLAVRNFPMIGVVLAPILGRSLSRADGRSTREASPPVAAAGGGHRSLRANRIVLVGIGMVLLVFGASIWAGPALALEPYPAAAVSALDHEGLLGPGHHLAHQDFVGNYLVLRYGRRAHAFIDDRYDMYPSGVFNDYEKLLHGSPGAMSVLERRGIDVVLWEKDFPIVSILEATPGWAQVYRDRDWVAFRRSPP